MAGLSNETALRVQVEMREFDRVAAMLGMPGGERYNILGLTEGTYLAWQAGRADMTVSIAPEFARRLAYALPLMRRMVANLPILPEGRHHARAQPSVN